MLRTVLSATRGEEPRRSCVLIQSSSVWLRPQGFACLQSIRGLEGPRSFLQNTMHTDYASHHDNKNHSGHCWLPSSHHICALLSTRPLSCVCGFCPRKPPVAPFWSLGGRDEAHGHRCSDLPRQLREQSDVFG